MTYYEQILNLKNSEIDDIARGNKFESIIREIQPWDKKPPIVMYPKTEELDGVFIYQNTVFIIESKAKKNTITAGSKDWEDYELKIHRRKGKGVIGLFCSLFEVNSDVVYRANSLNEQGIFNILIYGKNWDQLSIENLDFNNFLDFMILNSKINLVASVRNLNSAKKWYYDKKHINDSLNSMCEKQSSFFLRRLKHNHHEQIYVKRKIEKKLNHQIKLFCPSVLKKSKNESIEQLMLLRDKSGSGKTSLAIEKILANESAFSFGCTAKQIEIDVFFDNFLNQIQYKNYGLKELEAVDKPYLYIVDSLDEVFKKDQHQKRLEIKSLIKKIEELNSKAASENFRKFPLLVLFTLREEFWRDWDESFDGREVIYLKNMISSFSDTELDKALTKYSNVYNYKIENTLSSESKTILSIPINLEIFSVVNSYNGNIKVQEIWEGKILSKYFQRKHENILSKHYVEGLSEESFLSILSLIANYVVSNKNLIFDQKEIKKIIEDDFPSLTNYFSDIIKLLISEQIFIHNPDLVNLLRFKYTRFVEYLVSLYIIEKINNETKLYLLDEFIQKVFESQVVDIHTILKNIRQICQTKYVEIGEEITEYYQTSDVYLQKYLPRLRREIAYGKKTKSNDIQELIRKSYSQNPKITWDTFFIVSAKKNKQKKERNNNFFI